MQSSLVRSDRPKLCCKQARLRRVSWAGFLFIMEPRQKVLIKVYRDGLVEVYGSEGVDAKVVFLGRSITYPDHEIAVEEQLDKSLPPAYKAIHFPQNEIATALRGFDG